MKKLLISAIFLAVLSITAIYAQPKLRIVEGDSYKWGKVKAKDSPLKAKIHLMNDGDSLLIISNVKPSCGCTTAPLDKNQLKPGETATIDITLNISSNSGRVSKTVVITSNDLKQSTKVLSLEADVMVPIELLPYKFMNFNNVKTGEDTETRIKIKNSSEQNIKLSDFEINPKNMTINANSPIELKPNEEFELIAKIKPDKAGYFNVSIKMKTTHPDYPEFTIYGNGQATDPAAAGAKNVK